MDRFRSSYLVVVVLNVFELLLLVALATASILLRRLGHLLVHFVTQRRHRRPRLTETSRVVQLQLKSATINAECGDSTEVGGTRVDDRPPESREESVAITVQLHVCLQRAPPARRVMHAAPPVPA